MLEKFFEKRAISYQTLFASGDDIALGNLSATNINSDTAFKINAVYAATSLIADTISTLPMDVFVRRDGARFPFRPSPDWVQQPDVDLPREAFYSQIITSLLLDGNAFIRVFSNSAGQIVNMMTLNPTKVEVDRAPNGRLVFRVEGEDRPLTSEQIVFIPDLVRPGKVRGVNRVQAMRENLGLALGLESFAATFFGQGTNLNGVIEYPGDLTAEQAAQLSEAFSSNHRGWRRGHKTGVLTGGASFKSTQMDPDKSQAIEARRFAVEDVARAFNVPPHLLGVPGTNSYASVEQTNLAWVTHGLRPIVQKIEGALTPLMSRTPGGENAFIRFNLDGLLRADFATRMQGYSTGLQAGFLTVNDVRRREDLRPIDDEAANTVRVPLANVAIDESHVVAQNQKVAMAAQLVAGGFLPASVLEALDLPPIEHTGLPSVQVQAPENVTDEVADEEEAE
jgi:HK97 family phage portal protein